MGKGAFIAIGLLKTFKKNNRTLIPQPKCGLFLRYFYLPMISAKSTLRFS